MLLGLNLGLHAAKGSGDASPARAKLGANEHAKMKQKSDVQGRCYAKDILRCTE